MDYISTVEELSRKIGKLEGKKVLGSDTETTGFDPHTNKLRLLQLASDTDTLVIDVKKIGTEATAHYVRPYLEDKGVVKVFHNAKFDIKFIKQQLGIDVERIYDSYLASQMIEGGIGKEKGFHSLAQVLPRYTDIQVSKEEQDSDWWEDELSESQLMYAGKDAEVMLPLRESQKEYLKKLSLTRCAKLEFDAILPTAYIELCGFYLDIETWMRIAEESLVKANYYADLIYKELEPVVPQQSLFGAGSINLDSHEQVQKYFRELGVPMPNSTKEYLLTPLAERYEIVKNLIEYRGHVKSNGSFGQKFRSFVNEVTGRIHAQFMQIGAETGRYAVSNPNLNQIPSDADHRACFKVQSDDNILVSNDFSQEELRILADFSNDKRFKALFKTGEDFHKSTAALVFNIPLEKVSAHDRNIAKRLNFGLTYGVGIAKFALMAGITEMEAAQVRNHYFNTFTGVKRWINYQKVKVLETHSARTASGRLMYFHFDEDDGAERSKAQRNAVNGPIQGTGADILKRSLRLFYDATKDNQKDVKIVNVVHDQIDLEVRKDLAEEMKDVLRQCMIQAGSEFVKDVEIKVDSKINTHWVKE